MRNSMKRYAAHFLYETPSLVHLQYVVELIDGKVTAVFPLTEELASTVWLDGVIILSSYPDYKLKQELDFPALLDELCNGSTYAYHLSLLNMVDRTLLPNTTLKRL